MSFIKIVALLEIYLPRYVFSRNLGKTCYFCAVCTLLV